jgi:RNA polymerase sigma-70 factor (ECF subfamily)
VISQPGLEYESMSDGDLARRVMERDPHAVRLLTNRNNQRLFRVAWSILRNRAESEDVVQSTYLRAFVAMESFEGRSSLSTWLTRIAINEALGRQRSARRRRAQLDETSVVHLDEYRDKLMRGSTSSLSPEDSAAREQLRRLLEGAIARLPESFRVVFVLREIEGMGVDEVAETLGIPQPTVKTRHLRARRRLQEALAPEVQTALSGTFPFAGADCAAITERVVRAWCGDPSQ